MREGRNGRKKWRTGFTFTLPKVEEQEAPGQEQATPPPPHHPPHVQASPQVEDFIASLRRASEAADAEAKAASDAASQAVAAFLEAQQAGQPKAKRKPSKADLDNAEAAKARLREAEKASQDATERLTEAKAKATKAAIALATAVEAAAVAVARAPGGTGMESFPRNARFGLLFTELMASD